MFIWLSAGRTAGLTVVLSTVLTGCSRTNVEPVVPSDVAVFPQQVSALVQDETQLSAEVRDQDGNVLADRTPEWASIDPAVATVDERGRVTAVSPGITLVTATVESVVGAAQITVAPRPDVRLTPSSLSVELTEGAGGSARRTVRITNAGSVTANGLSVDVEYDQGGNGWLSGSLSRTAAPADLTVTARSGGLSRGRYTGRVVVSSAGGRRTVDVELVVREQTGEVRVSPTDIVFRAKRGASTPDRKTVQVTNAANGALAGLRTQVDYDGTSGWLSASLSRGTTPATLSLDVTTTGLKTGKYWATVRVTAPGAAPGSVRVYYRVR